MKLSDYSPEGLHDYDYRLYQEALEVRKDCNKWSYMKYLGSLVIDKEFSDLLISESDKMRHTLEFYENIEEE